MPSNITEIVFSGRNIVELRHATDADTELAGTDVALAPAYVGICGSDMHVLHGSHPWIRPPVVTGHEASATVTAVGPEVSHLKPGDRVIVNPLLHCGHCPHCQRGAVNICDEAQVLGMAAPGAARTRFRIDQTFVHPLPREIPLELGVLAEPLATAWHAVCRCDDLENVLIIGGGSIGLSILLALKIRGAGRTVLIEPEATKRQLSRELRVATEAHAPGTAPVDSPQYSTVIDCVASQETLDIATASVQNGGVLLMVGVPNEARRIPLPRMQRFEIDLRSSGLYLPTDIDTSIDLLHSGTIDPTPLISSIYPMEEAAAAYEAASKPDEVKILVQIQ